MSEDRRPAAGETWTFNATGLFGPERIKSVDVLFYHPATHTVLGVEHGDKVPTVYYPHQYRQWQPPKDLIPDLVRYVHVKKSNYKPHHGTATSTSRGYHPPTPDYKWAVKVEVRDGKATATVL